MVKKVEFVTYKGVGNKTQIPLPGMSIELYGGEEESNVKATIVEVVKSNRSDTEYRLRVSTNDKRMIDLSNTCDHHTYPDCQHGPDVCHKCNIVINKRI